MSPARRISFVLLILVAAAGLSRLGVWQLDRLHARRARNAQLRSAAARPPLLLPASAQAMTHIDSGRRIVAHGRFDNSDQVLLRSRVQNDAPGLQVVTPFVLDGDSAVIWVLRGFVPSADAATPPPNIPMPDTGVVTVAGVAAMIPSPADGGKPLLYSGATTFSRLDRATLAQRRRGTLAIYLQLQGDSAGVGKLPPSPIPELDDGPHLSYALQWFGMALAVLVFGVVALFRTPKTPDIDRGPP